MNAPVSTMKKRFYFDYTDLDAVRVFLEQKSREGWMVRSITGCRFEFTACEPRTRRINVEILPTADRSDCAPDGRTLEYLELCREAGWQDVAHAGPLYVFATEDPTIPDVVTDPAERIAAVKKSVKSTLRYSLICALPGCASVTPLFSGFFNDHPGFTLSAYFRAPSDYAGFSFLLLLPLTYLILLWISASRLISLRRWVKHAEQAAAQGLPLSWNGKSAAARRVRQVVLPLAVLFALGCAFALWGALAEKILLPGFTLAVTLLAVAAALFFGRVIARKQYTKKKYVLAILLSAVAVTAIVGALLAIFVIRFVD